MVPSDNDSFGEVRQALEEVMCDFVARGIQNILVVEDVSRDNDEGSLCLNRGMGTELGKEGVKDGLIFVFSGSFCISCTDMDIREVEDVCNRHFEDIYGTKLNQI